MDGRIETTGRSVEAALQSALVALGAPRAEVRWEVLDPGTPGFLGWVGRRPARVRVERVTSRHTDVRELVVDLLAVMQVEATVHVEQTPEVLQVSIATQGLDGLLIGKHGQTLVALQHVIGRLASKEFGITAPVSVDVGGYRRRREAQLVEKARALAEKVRVTGREINLEPLHAPDRRIVHLALAGEAGVRTYTVGQGQHRNVVIAPATRARRT
jgi:spoIIIJ-associated protein